ncbi:unnamed protein product [Dovyalis caffra]|uniref:Uncharacterized protein n=1 Tax=Dovyalis caffra TaxID=77055 RepID=A0AAV1RQR9_9ROSI|nr:unnamed protein product [Dovyalis caffra]
MEVSASKENISMPPDPEDNKVIQCVSNCQDKGFHDDQTREAVGSEDVEVNIIDCTNPSNNEQIEARYEDLTESMSSFGDTESDTKNGSSAFSDTEVESQLFVEGGPTSIFDGYGGAFQMRRKKLTDHWRRFIRPLMWRCKWVELQIKEFQSQALKYDREIAEHGRRKQFDLETFMAEGFPVKSLPFSTCTTRKKAMKRKKRKRFEETADVASYMLQHNLFSYYENKKSATDGASIDDGCGNPAKTISDHDEFGFQDGLASLQSRDNISEHILRQIEVLKLQVHKLKGRVDKVAHENPVKFSSVNVLSLLASSNPSNSSDRNPASVPKNGDTMSVRLLDMVSQRMPGCNIGDLMPETAVSSQGEATSRSDMIECPGLPQGGVSCGNAEKEILLRNAAVKEEIGNFKNFDSGLTEKPWGVMEKQTIQASEPDLPEEMLVARVRFGGKSLPKSRSNVSNNKRKRGRRK